MARIAGDTEDLPDGWKVDRDNWGYRRARVGDQAKINSDKKTWTRACIEGGRVCVHTARVARLIDGKA